MNMIPIDGVDRNVGEGSTRKLAIEPRCPKTIWHGGVRPWPTCARPRMTRPLKAEKKSAKIQAFYTRHSAG